MVISAANSVSHGPATSPVSAKVASDSGVKSSSEKTRKKAVDLHTIDAPELKFTKVKTVADIDSLAISDKAKKNLKRLMTKFKAEEGTNDDNFISVNVNEQGRAMIHMAGKQADTKLFKRGFLHTLTGWLPRLCGGMNWGIAAKFAKKGNVLNVSDPSNNEAKAEPPQRIFEGLADNRYTICATYDLEGDKPKEPEAIAVYDNFHVLIEKLKENLPNNLPEEVKEQIMSKFDDYDAQGMKGMCVCSTVLYRDDIKDSITGTDNQSKFGRQQFFAEFGTTCSPDTTVVIPTDIFGPEFAKSGDHAFEIIEGLKTLELMKDGNSKEIDIPRSEVVRPLSTKSMAIPAEAFAQLFAAHKLNELTTKPGQLTEDLAQQIMDIQKVNQKAVENFNEKINPTKTTEEAEETAK